MSAHPSAKEDARSADCGHQEQAGYNNEPGRIKSRFEHSNLRFGGTKVDENLGIEGYLTAYLAELCTAQSLLNSSLQEA
jgi:hypothetical protein